MAEEGGRDLEGGGGGGGGGREGVGGFTTPMQPAMAYEFHMARANVIHISILQFSQLDQKSVCAFVLAIGNGPDTTADSSS